MEGKDCRTCCKSGCITYMQYQQYLKPFLQGQLILTKFYLATWPKTGMLAEMNASKISILKMFV